MAMIEGYYPTLPKLELNSRRSRSGWTVWGFDSAPSIQFLPIADVCCDRDHHAHAVEQDNLDIPAFLKREPVAGTSPA
jgi:hypothetical protein